VHRGIHRQISHFAKTKAPFVGQEAVILANVKILANKSPCDLSGY
jgi:hypothetical protein